VALCLNISDTPPTSPTCSSNTCLTYNNCIGSEPQRCGSGTDTVERTATACTDPQRFRMDLAEGQRRLPGGATAPYAPAAESCRRLYVRKSN
jgi:hypothetical protein